jgi:hypothetical protein
LRFSFLSVSKTPKSRKYFIKKNGNRILTAISEITGHSTFTDSQMCSVRAHNISGLSAFTSVTFSWASKGGNVGKHQMDHEQSGNLPNSSKLKDIIITILLIHNFWVHFFPGSLLSLSALALLGEMCTRCKFML